MSGVLGVFWANFLLKSPLHTEELLRNSSNFLPKPALDLLDKMLELDPRARMHGFICSGLSLACKCQPCVNRTSKTSQIGLSRNGLKRGGSRGVLEDVLFWTQFLKKKHWQSRSNSRPPSPPPHPPPRRSLQGRVDLNVRVKEQNLRWKQYCVS